MNRNHKKYKLRFSKLKKQYKNAVKRQLAREFFLLSESDINHDCLFAKPLAETDRLFEVQDEREYTTFHSIDDEIETQGDRNLVHDINICDTCAWCASGRFGWICWS